MSCAFGPKVWTLEPSLATNGHSYSTPTAGMTRPSSLEEESPPAGSSDEIQLASACV